MARRRARELAFRTLFQSERGGSPLLEVWHQVREDAAEEPEPEADAAYGEALDAPSLAFAGQLVTAFDQHREEIDRELAELVTGWSFGQMAQTDLNILRLATTEMRFASSGPPEVAIEMAVRLAKKFGGEESGRFVNGVLAKLYRRLASERA
ncbi:MAG TPA: transcription antitermination factor NusB [Trueperaceae bacterium]|nr:transcription antitermination factor NusB [Trueperaceae bacterium]